MIRENKILISVIAIFFSVHESSQRLLPPPPGTTLSKIVHCCVIREFVYYKGRIQNIDRGPWTTSWTRSMDHHGPAHGPGPWTRFHGPSLIFERKSPLSILYENLPKVRVWKTQTLIYCLPSWGLSRKSVLFWDRSPMNGKTTNSFWDTEDLVHFYPQYFHSNTFKLQFDREDTHSPVNPPLTRLYRA